MADSTVMMGPGEPPLVKRNVAGFTSVVNSYWSTPNSKYSRLKLAATLTPSTATRVGLDSGTGTTTPSDSSRRTKASPFTHDVEGVTMLQVVQSPVS